MRAKALVAIMLIVVGAQIAAANLPIEIRYGVGRNRIAVKLWKDAEDQLKNGDIENAKRNGDAALADDPTLQRGAAAIPAIHRSGIVARQCKRSSRALCAGAQGDQSLHRDPSAKRC